MDWQLRPLSAADELFLWEMLYQAVHVPPGAAPPPPDIVRLPDLARYVAGWGRPGDSGLLALAGGQPVGAAWLRLWHGGDRGYGYVADDIPELSIAVVPGRRGAGIGGALIRALLADASRLHPAVSLSVSPDNPARRLYERLGFQVAGQQGGSLVMLWRPPDAQQA